jgi:hypothetical protein
MKYTNIRNGLRELDEGIKEKLTEIKNSSSRDAEIMELNRKLSHFDEFSNVFYSEAGDSIYMHYTYRDDEGLNIETLALPVWFVEDFDNHMAALG